MSKILDAWAGETVTYRGQRYFEVNGKLIPAISGQAVTRMPTPWAKLRRWLSSRDRVLFKPDPLTGLGHRSLLQEVPVGLGIQGWEETLAGIVADGTQVSNTTSETILAPDFNIPAFYMAPGRILRIWAFGVNSNVVTTPGTLTLRVRWGGVGGVALLQSAAIGLDTTARTNALWDMVGYIVCRTEGSAGSFMSGGEGSIVNVLASVGISNNGVFSALRFLMGSAGTPIASGNAAVSVDTTIAKLLSLTAQFSVATSPTNLTCQQRIIEALN